MARFDIRETPSLDRRPEPRRGRRPERVPERPGHRRNYDPLQEKHTIAERKDAAVADVSHYRVVAVADIVRERFGGNPYAASKALDQMKAAGWVTERTLEGPEGGKYRVLSPTTTGAREARTQGLSWGMDPQQRAWDGAASKSRDMAHDVAIYRAARAEQARIEERGRTLRRIRTDAELKAAINSRSEAARQQGGREAADRARFEAAEALHLPIRNGQVQYPDAQLEFLEPDGLTQGHVNIEVVSGNYRAADIAAKAAAGFQMHGKRERPSAVAHRPGRKTRPVERSRWGCGPPGATAGQGSYRIMKPIFFGVGITAAWAGTAVLLVGPRLDFLSPWWGTIVRAYGLTLALHVAALLVTSIVVFYALARVLGLADLGRRVDLVERGIRRGSGDRDLQQALDRSDQGLYLD